MFWLRNKKIPSTNLLMQASARNGAAGIRTHNLPLRKRTLYQLIYRCGLITRGYISCDKNNQLQIAIKRVLFLCQQFFAIVTVAKGSAHAPVNGGPVFPGTILGYFGLIKHFLAEFLLFSIILYITLAL